MQSKSLLIAIAAFAVTATGVQAYQGTKLLERAGLTEEQISAFETARELREAGNINAARDVLVEAGVDENVLESVREAVHEERYTLHDDLTDEQNEALAVARMANDKEAVQAILVEAGLTPPRERGHHY